MVISATLIGTWKRGRGQPSYKVPEVASILESVGSCDPKLRASFSLTRPARYTVSLGDMTLLRAKGMQRVALQFWQVGAAWNKADREAQAEARRRLLQKLILSDSADRQPGG